MNFFRLQGTIGYEKQNYLLLVFPLYLRLPYFSQSENSDFDDLSITCEFIHKLWLKIPGNEWEFRIGMYIIGWISNRRARLALTFWNIFFRPETMG